MFLVHVSLVGLSVPPRLMPLHQFKEANYSYVIHFCFLIPFPLFLHKDTVYFNQSLTVFDISSLKSLTQCTALTKNQVPTSSDGTRAHGSLGSWCWEGLGWSIGGWRWQIPAVPVWYWGMEVDGAGTPLVQVSPMGLAWAVTGPARDAANSCVCTALLHPADHIWAIQGRTETPAALAGCCGLDSISTTWFLWQRQSAVYSAWRRTGYNCRDVVCSVFFQATVWPWVCFSTLHVPPAFGPVVADVSKDDPWNLQNFRLWLPDSDWYI